MPTLLFIGLIFTTVIASIRMIAWLYTMFLILKHKSEAMDEIKRLHQTTLKIAIGGLEHLIILATLIGIFIFMC